MAVTIPDGLIVPVVRNADRKTVSEISREVKDATIVFVVCDRGDRYLSTGVFPA